MPDLRSQPRDRSLFSLVPVNDRAMEAVNHPHNRHLAYRYDEETLALDVGFHIRPKSRSPSTLATLGRGDAADIFIDGSSMSRIQCSFDINLDSKVIMLVDRSGAQTTQVYKGTAPDSEVAQFEYGRPLPPQVVIMESYNEKIGMGGTHRDLVTFTLRWHQTLKQVVDMLKKRETVPQDYKQEVEECPRLAHTCSQELETIPPSRMETRAHAPAQMRMRYKQMGHVGGGSFGTVYEGLDLDHGRFMAIKTLQQFSTPKGSEQFKQSLYYARKREVETLSRITHPHIVQFYHSQGWETPIPMIFMALKEGSLNSLAMRSDWPDTARKRSEVVVHQMLQALDFLAFNHIVHRDVKPENILYSSRPGTHDYIFQLGDFGLCNQYSQPTSMVGTAPYMAPEVHEGEEQTPKVDIWSLSVTMLWILDTGGFRQILASSKGKKPQYIQNAVTRAAKDSSHHPALRPMARIDARDRATAAQLLVTYFEGEGLTTRGRIRPIIELMDLDLPS
ncbi:MAG: hypothetical protein Q9177_004256 [Variospora cf. flavescens]